MHLKNIYILANNVYGTDILCTPNKHNTVHLLIKKTGTWHKNRNKPRDVKDFYIVLIRLKRSWKSISQVWERCTAVIKAVVLKWLTANTASLVKVSLSSTCAWSRYCSCPFSVSHSGYWWFFLHPCVLNKMLQGVIVSVEGNFLPK